MAAKISMKILITGSSGYVGYVLAKHFSEKGIKVVGIDLAPNHAWLGNKDFVFYKCDITDRTRLFKIFGKEKPTHVIHLAYLMNPLHDVKREYAIDVKCSMYTLQAADATKTVKQFIQFSSTSAYGAWPNNKPWIKEEQILRPRDYRYGINKKKVEEIYNNFPKRKDLKMVIMRMCTALGPLYHKPGGVVAILTNAPLMIKFGGRYCELQFPHEDDLTALIELVANDNKVEGTFNLCPDSYATTKQLAKDKLFIPMPLWLMRGIVSVLWTLHLAEMRAAAMTLSTYGIIADPGKLMKRYNYKFKYSTYSGFVQTVKERKRLGTL
ncbi:MAG: NAD-dependent epimerase/dehydratase family protein [Candidatus Woesearchaeota archaeon]